MNLFISNSNADPKSIKVMTSHKLYGKLILVIGSCLLLAMVLVQFILAEMGAKSQGVIGRVLESKAALQQIIAEPNDLVLFYGSSMTRAAFSACQFDTDLAQLGKTVKSFNFGFGGLNPYFQDFYSRRITEDFKVSERKIKLTMIEFNPFQATQTRWHRAAPVVDSFLTLLATDPELIKIAEDDVTRAIRLLTIKYLRNNISAEMITSVLGREIFPPTQHQRFKDNENIIAERRRLGNLLNDKFEQEYPHYQPSQWSYEWQGAGTIPEERTAETLALFNDYYAVTQTDNQMKNDRLSRIRSADIEDLNCEPLFIEHFINIVKNFQQVSDSVEIIMLPKNSQWIKTSDAADLRLIEVVQYIEQATGLKIKNHQNITEITPAMYRDTTHLSRYRGDVAYTNYLLKEYQHLFTTAGVDDR